MGGVGAPHVPPVPPEPAPHPLRVLAPAGPKVTAAGAGHTTRHWGYPAAMGTAAACGNGPHSGAVPCRAVPCCRHWGTSQTCATRHPLTPRPPRAPRSAACPRLQSAAPARSALPITYVSHMYPVHGTCTVCASARAALNPQTCITLCAVMCTSHPRHAVHYTPLSPAPLHCTLHWPWHCLAPHPAPYTGRGIEHSTRRCTRLYHTAIRIGDARVAVAVTPHPPGRGP